MEVSEGTTVHYVEAAGYKTREDKHRAAIVTDANPEPLAKRKGEEPGPDQVSLLVFMDSYIMKVGHIPHSGGLEGATWHWKEDVYIA